MDTAEASHDMNGADQLMDAAQGVGQSTGNGWEPKSEFAKSAEMVHEPGSCWNNKKAREEWQKAWNQIEDKNFSLSEYSLGMAETVGAYSFLMQRSSVTLSMRVKGGKEMKNDHKWGMSYG